MAVSLIGIILEPMMMMAVFKRKNDGYIRAWLWLAGFTVVFSVVLALSFLLHNLDVIKIGGSWFDNALCVLADLVFFYVPFYMLGPRLIPVLTALLIIAHMVLPVLHGLAFYVVFSYYKSPRMVTRQATPTAPKELEEQQQALNNHHAAHLRAPKLCQKCAIARGENGGVPRCGGTPLINDQMMVETTC